MPSTWIVRQDGTGNYTTLAAALSNASTVNDDTISIEGTWSINDTAAATVADNGITITANASSRVDPGNLASPTHYRLRVNSSGSHALTVNNNTCTVNGLEIQQVATGTSDEAIRLNTNAVTFTLKNSLLWAAAVTSQQDGLYHGSNSVTNITVENTMAFGFSRGGFHAQFAFNSDLTGTWNINSCTLFDNGHENGSATTAPGGIGAARNSTTSTLNMNVFNTLSLRNTVGVNTGDFAEGTGTNTTVNWDIHNCIDSDGTVSKDSGNVECLSSRTAVDDPSPGEGDHVIFTDITGAVPWDLELQSSDDNDAQEMHSTTTGAGLTIPASDISGTTRSAAYSCGAHHIAAAAPAGGAVRSPLGYGAGLVGGPFKGLVG